MGLRWQCTGRCKSASPITRPPLCNWDSTPSQGEPMPSMCMSRPFLLKEFHSHHKVEPLGKLLAVCTTAFPGRRQKLTWSSNLKRSGCCSKSTILGVKPCCRQSTSHSPPLSLIHQVVQLSYLPSVSEGSDIIRFGITDKCNQPRCPAVDE